MSKGTTDTGVVYQSNLSHPTRMGRVQKVVDAKTFHLP